MKTKSPALTLLLIAYLAFVLIGMTGGMLNIAWVQMQTTFNVSLDSLGVLLAVSTIGHLTTSFVSGRVIGRIGLGVFLVVGALLVMAGALGTVLAPTWPLLLLASLIMWAGGGVFDSALNTFVSANYSAGRLNWLHAAFGIGLTIGPMIVTFFVVNLEQSWRWSYGVSLVLGAVVLVLILLNLKRWTIGGEQASQDSVSSGPAPRFTETLKQPIIFISLALFFVYAGSEQGMGQLTNNLFTQARGVPQATAGAWISLYWGTFTIGRIIMGVVADRVHTPTLIRGALGASIVGAVLLALNLGDFGNAAALVITGFAFAPVFPLLIAETPRRTGLRHAANAIGFEIGSSGLGIALLPGLAGVLADHAGLETIGLSLIAMTVATFILHEMVLLREARMAVQPG